MKKLNKSLQISLKKLDKIIGPPPKVYKKPLIKGSCSTSTLPLYPLTKKPLLNRTLTFQNTPINSKSKKIIFPNEDSISFSSEDKTQIYVARCKDLNIPAVPHLKKRYSEYLEGVCKDRCMKLTENRLGPNAAEALGKIIRNNCKFSKLELAKNSLGDEGIRIISGYLNENDCLIHIGLSCNGIKPEGACEFFKSVISNKSLVSIDISSRLGINKNKLGTLGSAPIRQLLQKNPLIQFLNLSDCQIGEEGIAFIIEGLCTNMSLEYLDVSFNLTGSKPIKELMKSVAVSRLKELNISGNQLGNDGAEAIGEFLMNLYSEYSYLSVLSIASNEITNRGANKIFNGLAKNRDLLTLNIENNPLGENAGQYILSCLEGNNTLNSLNLASCNLNETGAQKLSEALSINKSLRVLSLRDNNLKNDGALHLSSALQANSTLLDLDLSSNDISKHGAYKLFTSVKQNPRLFSLNLKSNQLKDNIAEFIMDCSRNKPNFQVLKLENNYMSERCLKKIDEVLFKNQSSHKEVLSSHLKTEIFELSKNEFTIDQVRQAINEKMQEKGEVIQRIDYHRKTVEDIKESICKQVGMLQEELEIFKKKHWAVCEVLDALEREVEIGRKRFEDTIEGIKREKFLVGVEIKELEEKSNEYLVLFIVPKNLKLKKNMEKEQNQVKEQKIIAIKEYKQALNEHKAAKRKLIDMQLKREKAKNPEPVLKRRQTKLQ